MFSYLCADSASVGRFDPSVLTQQQIFELFFTPADEEEFRHRISWTPDGCTWTGVQCTKEGIVGKIEWTSWHVQLQGSIDIRRMPRNTQFINFFNQALTGEIDATNLPESLHTLCLQECAFSGTIDLGHLPRGMVVLEMYDNRVTGVQNICNLPAGLEYLIIREFHIREKSVDVGALPASDLRVNLIGCGFTAFACERPEDKHRVKI